MDTGVSSQQVRHSIDFSGLGFGFSGSRTEPKRELTMLRGRSGDLIEGARSPSEVVAARGRSTFLLGVRLMLVLGFSTLRR